jgi:hypothetical protein
MRNFSPHLVLYPLLLGGLGWQAYQNAQLRQAQGQAESLLAEAVTGVSWNVQNQLDELRYYAQQAETFNHSGRPDSVRARLRALDDLRTRYYAETAGERPDSADQPVTAPLRRPPLGLYAQARLQLRYQRQVRTLMTRLSNVYGGGNLLHDPNYLWTDWQHPPVYEEGDTALLGVTFHTSFDRREDAWRVVGPVFRPARRLSAYRYVFPTPTAGALRDGAVQRRLTTVAGLVVENRLTAARETLRVVVPYTVRRRVGTERPQ